MNYRFAPQELPTLARYRAMRRRTPGASILRALQYEALENAARRDAMKGRFLDFGGGRTATYVPLLPSGLELASVNIDAQYQPTHIIEPGAALPFEPASFDGAICMNVLEHIYDARGALDQIFEALKPAGTLYLSIPFIFRVHGHPDDFSRHTSSWWRETLKRCGFSDTAITPLVWGRRTTAQLVAGKGLLKSVNTWRAVLADIAIARASFSRHGNYTDRVDRHVNAVAPGWFIVAKK